MSKETNKKSESSETRTRLESLLIKSKAVRISSSDLVVAVRIRVERAFGETFTSVPEELIQTLEEEEELSDIQNISMNLTIAITNAWLIHGWFEGGLREEVGKDELEPKVSESTQCSLVDEMRGKSKHLLDAAFNASKLMDMFMSQFLGSCHDDKSDDSDKPEHNDVDLTDNDLDRVEVYFSRMESLIRNL